MDMRSFNGRIKFKYFKRTFLELNDNFFYVDNPNGNAQLIEPIKEFLIMSKYNSFLCR